ncbi:MAG: QueT transporter family protein [Lachnospiraceae bacterium]|jgi:uncharacterized membrane protein|nr:QueT transporter family protein [Lachnospiraceae bacterium]
MKENKVLFMAQAAMIAAIYVALCIIFAPISYGAIQVRIAEALTILPYFTPAAIPGLFIGCIIANILGGSILIDVILGSLATLLGAMGTYLLRKNNRFLAPIPPILSNTLLVPFILRYGYGEPLPIPFLMATVGIGEIAACGIMGIILLTILIKYKKFIFRTA